MLAILFTLIAQTLSLDAPAWMKPYVITIVSKCPTTVPVLLPCATDSVKGPILSSCLGAQLEEINPDCLDQTYYSSNFAEWYIKLLTISGCPLIKAALTCSSSVCGTYDQTCIKQQSAFTANNCPL